MNNQEIQKLQQKMLTKITIESDSKHTIKKYNTAFNNFNIFINKYNITTINADNINDIQLLYLKYLKQDTTLTNNSITQYMILIKNFLKNECKFNMEYIRLPKAEKREPKYINHQQYQEIQKHLEQKYKNAKTQHQAKTIKTDQTIINIIFNTGLRIHEVLKIKIQEVQKIQKDHNNIYQLDVIGKGNKKRTIIFASETYDAISEYIKQYGTSEQTYIFESIKKPGTPITTMTVERHFKAIAKELDIINSIDPSAKDSYTNLFKPHNLRHSFAVVKLENGIPINAMQQLLGHNDIKTTQIYTELNANGLSDAYVKTL